MMMAARHREREPPQLGSETNKHDIDTYEGGGGGGLNLGWGKFFMCSGHLLNCDQLTSYWEGQWPITEYQMHVGTRTCNKKTLRWHQVAPRHPNV